MKSVFAISLIVCCGLACCRSDEKGDGQISRDVPDNPGGRKTFDDSMNLNQCRMIVKDIEGGVISVPETGYIRLPDQYRHVATYGTAMAHQRHGSIQVIIPTWRGKGWNLIAYAYIGSGVESVLSENANDAPAKVALKVPGPAGGSRPLEVDFLVEKRVDSHWLIIRRHLD